MSGTTPFGEVGNPSTTPMNFADKSSIDRMFFYVVFNEIHGTFDVLDLFDPHRHIKLLFQLSLYILKKRGVISLDASRADTLQHMKNALEVEENLGRSCPIQTFFSKMVQIDNKLEESQK